MIIRESRKIKQARIAALMITSQKTVSEIECGQIDPKLSRVRAYAKALGLNLYVGGTDTFPDLEAMTLDELIDLYYLMGEELQGRLASAMNPANQECVDVAE